MDVMAGDPCVYCWDVQIEDEHRRKGVGKHLLTLLSLIGTREKMMHLCLPVQMFDDHSRLWIESVKGFAPDTSLKKLIGFDSEMEVNNAISHRS
jgi:GNAT superfamily N-acetyltransferase